MGLILIVVLGIVAIIVLNVLKKSGVKLPGVSVAGGSRQGQPPRGRCGAAAARGEQSGVAAAPPWASISAKSTVHAAVWGWAAQRSGTGLGRGSVRRRGDGIGAGPQG